MDKKRFFSHKELQIYSVSQATHTGFQVTVLKTINVIISKSSMRYSHRNAPTTRDMILRITNAIETLNSDEILRANNNFQTRVDLCIQQNDE